MNHSKPSFHKNKKDAPKKDFRKERSEFRRKPRPGKYPRTSSATQKEDDGTIRLNRFIAKAGICSRRDADDLISSGVISVNGKIVTEMGIKVTKDDEVRYNGAPIHSEELVYVLLNKPKDFITTTDDPEERKTVMELVRNACRERIYPVGRLDRSTTGLLLLTNDGELAKRLTHPRYGVRKIYQASLDKKLRPDDLAKIKQGVELEDGIVKADEITYVDSDKSEIGIELHSGQNRVVRRIFESLGYKVRKLDRVFYAGLTKKNLPRGEWRLLSKAEVNMLKVSAGNDVTSRKPERLPDA